METKEKDLFLEKITQLYEAGKFGDVIWEIIDMFPDPNQTAPEILEKLAWAYYQNKRYTEVGEIISLAQVLGYNNFAEIKNTIESYAGRDANAASKYLDAVGEDNLRACNQFIIAAYRSEDDPTQHIERACGLVYKHRDSREISAIHLQNNMGRLYLTIDDPESAIHCFARAYTRYGYGNLHHRAALKFWVAKAYQEIGQIVPAIDAITLCQELWREAIIADPSNGSFLNNLANANGMSSYLHARRS